MAAEHMCALSERVTPLTVHASVFSSAGGGRTGRAAYDLIEGKQEADLDDLLSSLRRRGRLNHNHRTRSTT